MTEQQTINPELQSSDELLDALYLLDPDSEDASAVRAVLVRAFIREMALSGDDLKAQNLANTVVGMDVSGQHPPRCEFCTSAETSIARQAFKLEAVMDENDALRTRNTELISDNRKLRLELGHTRPSIAAMAPMQEEA